MLSSNLLRHQRNTFVLYTTPDASSASVYFTIIESDAVTGHFDLCNTPEKIMIIWNSLHLSRAPAIRLPLFVHSS